MGATLLFITHPEVVVDPSTPATRWSLSAVGRQRMLAFMCSGALDATGSIFNSGEQKALDAAVLVSEHIGANVRVVPELGENDRSSTGYMENPAQARAAVERWHSGFCGNGQRAQRSRSCRSRVNDVVRDELP